MRAKHRICFLNDYMLDSDKSFDRYLKLMIHELTKDGSGITYPFIFLFKVNIVVRFYFCHDWQQ
jgi:hypothetical protein